MTVEFVLFASKNILEQVKENEERDPTTFNKKLPSSTALLIINKTIISINQSIV